MTDRRGTAGRAVAVATAATARTTTTLAAAGAAVMRIIRAEVSTYRSLWLWALRRVDGQGPGVAAIGYARGSLGQPLAFGVLTVAEAVAIHLLVPWAVLRALILVASGWSLVALLGVAAARAVHPHLLTGSQLVLRAGAHVVATLDLDAVTRAARVRRYEPTSPAEVDGWLSLPSQDGTNVDLHLADPVPAHVPAFLKRHRRRAMITAASIHVDEPDTLLSLIADNQGDRSTSTRKQ